jgi:AcrR family transcriptional regulator
VQSGEPFTRHGVSGITTQQIADRADVAIGTLFL